MQVTFIRIFTVSLFLLCTGKSAKTKRKTDCDYYVTTASEWTFQFSPQLDTYTFMKERDFSVSKEQGQSEKDVAPYFRNLPSWKSDKEDRDTGRMQLCVLAPPKRRVVLKIPQFENGARFGNKTKSSACVYPFVTAWQSTSNSMKKVPLDRNTRHLSSRKTSRVRELCRTQAGRRNNKQICLKHKKRRRLKKASRTNSSLSTSRRHGNANNNDVSSRERSIGNLSELTPDKKALTSLRPPATSNVQGKVIKTHKKSRKRRQAIRNKKNNWLRIFQLCCNSNSPRGYSQKNSYYNVQNVANSSLGYSDGGGNSSSSQERTVSQLSNVVINTTSNVLFVEIRWRFTGQLPELTFHFQFENTFRGLSGTLFSTLAPRDQVLLTHSNSKNVSSTLKNTPHTTLLQHPAKNNSSNLSTLVIVISMATLFFVTMFFVVCYIYLRFRRRSVNRRLHSCDIFRPEISSQIEESEEHEQITEPGGRYCCEKNLLKSHHIATTNPSENHQIKSQLVGNLEKERCYRHHSRHKDKKKTNCTGCCNANSLEPITPNTPFMLYSAQTRKPAGAKGLMHNNISTTQLAYSRPQNNPYTAESLSLKNSKCLSTVPPSDARNDDVTIYVTKQSKQSRMGYHDARPISSSCVRAPPNRTVAMGNALDNLSRLGNAPTTTIPFHSVTPASSDRGTRGGVVTGASHLRDNPCSTNYSNQIDMFFPTPQSRDFNEEGPPPEYSSPPEYNSLSPNLSPT